MVEPSGDAIKDAHDRMADAVGHAVGDGEMVLKWVVQIETMDMDGQRGVLLLRSDSCAPWDVIGLTSYALAREKSLMEALTWTSIGDGEEEDDDGS